MANAAKLKPADHVTVSAFNSPPRLGDVEAKIARWVSRHCYLAHPKVVKAFDGRVFPAERNSDKRGTADPERGIVYDDNGIAGWAMFWSHGMHENSRSKGWHLAHVWPSADHKSAHTHLANLCVMPQGFGNLSDTGGPLAGYLQYHAYKKYGWHPEGSEPPGRPSGYFWTRWNYLPRHKEPQQFVQRRLEQSNNKAAIALREVMGLNNVNP